MKFCPACRDVALKEWHQRRYLERTGQAELSTEITCADCKSVIPRTGNTQRYCKDCGDKRANEKVARWRLANPDKVKATQAAVDKKRKFDEGRRERNRIYSRAFAAARRDDPKRRLHKRMSQQIYIGLKTGKAGKTWTALTGYSVDELQRHLERQFLKGMTWSNMGDWHIDHILPVAGFCFTKPTDADFKACWAITNLRPLWATENIKKSAKRTHLL